MKFSITDFFSKCDKILTGCDRIWSHSLTKSLIENFIFCGVSVIRFAVVTKVFIDKKRQWSCGGWVGHSCFHDKVSRKSCGQSYSINKPLGNANNHVVLYM